MYVILQIIRISTIKFMKDYLFLFRGGLDFSTAPAEQVQQMIRKWQVAKP